MFKTAALRVLEWAKVVILPILTDWWDDIGLNPRSHFVSMVFGIAMVYLIKFGVWLAA